MGDAGNSVRAQAGESRRFAAFLSYSHADAGAAAKLQRTLERYRLPKRIAEARNSAVSAIGPIFRDREDLAAASSLTAAIRDAIGRAEALVVVCSPDAAASPWVAAEIELFRELHPEKPILAAMLSGDPAVSFPAALTANGNEPLAADLRANGDGEQLGFLKIVAGIAGVPLDALIQRDAQRRLRRVTAITAGALAAMLIMGIMTALALQARNEAARQRAAAEGLVEYMLTDLRTNLEGVGSFKVMDAVNARAMEHYRRQGNLSDLSADSLERRARVLHLIGEDLEKRGELERSLASFREAHRATGALLAIDPRNPDRIFAHAQSEYWVGHSAELKQDWATARSHYAQYAAAAKRLIEINPSDPDYMMEMGWGALNLGIILQKSRQSADFGSSNFDLAIDWFARARRIQPKLPNIEGELANAYAWLADSYLLQKDISRSFAARQRELLARKNILAADPANNDARFQVAKAEFAVAYNQIQTGRYSEAFPLLTKARDTLADLRALEPANAEWREISDKINRSITQMKGQQDG